MAQDSFSGVKPIGTSYNFMIISCNSFLLFPNLQTTILSNFSCSSLLKSKSAFMSSGKVFRSFSLSSSRLSFCAINFIVIYLYCSCWKQVIYRVNLFLRNDNKLLAYRPIISSVVHPLSKVTM
jgi:hypothetical protein